MKKMNSVAKFGAGAIGAVALTLGAAGVVSAQDADEDTTDPVVTEDATDEERAARREARQERKAERRVDLAEIIGISVEELTAAREDGQSLADIAGDSTDAVVDYFVDSATERVDARVEEGRLTEEEAAERLAGIEERITERVENADGEREGRRGNRGNRGNGGADAADADAVETVDS